MKLNVLQAYKKQRAAADETARLDVLRRLREALGQHAPGAVVWIYGSVLEQGRFHEETSDVDVAIEQLPSGLLNLYTLQSLLSSSLGREVDVCFLEELRFADRIRENGEKWTLSP